MNDQTETIIHLKSALVAAEKALISATLHLMDHNQAEGIRALDAAMATTAALAKTRNLNVQ